MNYVDPIKSKSDIKMVEEWLTKHNLRNRLIFAIGMNTGLRISDILSLNISDVYGKTQVEIREKKTNKYKRLFLNNKLQKLLSEYLENTTNSDEPLFIGKKGYRLHRSQVYRFLNEACNAVGIKENIGCHSLRKSFGYHHYKQFDDIVLLQKIFNHSSPAVSLRYIGIDQEIIENSYKNFEL
ncbi:MAG: site-specific integrase [Cyanobacteria bacterium RUI128]|nr:site-specific integrase [Cyanobacteria bacterium RUI128]